MLLKALRAALSPLVFVSLICAMFPSDVAAGVISPTGPNRPASLNGAQGHTLEPLAGKSIDGGAEILHLVHPGELWQSVRERFGMPTISSFHENSVEWAYPALKQQGWYVVRFDLQRVVSVQIATRYNANPSFTDESGVSLGDSIEKLQRMGAVRVHDSTPYTYVIRGAGPVRIYGAGHDGKVDRIGFTSGETTLSGWIRWYKFDGLTPERAISQSDAYGGGIAGEERYLHEHTCGFTGATWQELGRQEIEVRGARVIAARAQCGHTGFKAIKYFADGPRPAFIIDLPRTRAVLSASRFPKAGSSTNAVWVSRYAWNDGDPNFVPMIDQPPNGNGILFDFYVGYNSDPSDPITAVNLYIDLPTQYQTTSSTTPPVAFSPSARHESVRRPLTFPNGGLAGVVACATSGGTGKCNGGFLNMPPGMPCITPVGATAAGEAIVGPTFCIIQTLLPELIPSAHQCGQGSVGKPVNVVTGQVWFKTVDLSASGPNPLTFFHRYDSTFPQYQGSLGEGWSSPFDARLDLTNLSYGQVAFIGGDCQIEYFGNVDGSPSYDGLQGSTIIQDSDGTFKVVRWNKEVYKFDSSGRLINLIDRVGNVLTISRNSGGGITGATDSFGRSLSFVLDSKNRITSMSSSPSGVSVSFTYDSGTNCYTGDMCTAKESDGGTWTFQYFNPSSYGGGHYLMEVLDPLGHVEENNTFSQVTLPNYDVPTYRIATQQTDGGSNSLSFQYSQCSCSALNYMNTTVTDGLGRQATFEWNILAKTLLSSPALYNNGEPLTFSYDDFSRSLNDGWYTTFAYNRDTIITNPDQSSWTYVPYPGATDIYSPQIQTRTGLQSFHNQIQYYPVSDVRNDLPYQILSPSVDTAGKTITDTYTFNTIGELTAYARQGYRAGVSQTLGWSLAYETDGSIASITKPRTDVLVKEQFGYFPATDSQPWRRGQLSTYTDPLGHVTQYAADTSSNCNGACNNYTPFGEPESVTDPNGVIRDISYDPMGRSSGSHVLAGTGYPTQLNWSETYDAAGRPFKVLRPSGAGTQFNYDNNNNLLAFIRLDSSGNQREQVATAYDVMSEGQTQTMQSCSTPAPTCASWTTVGSRTFSYTPFAQLMGVTYGSGSTAEMVGYTYNTNNPDLATATWGNQPSFTNWYSEDQAHNLTQYEISGSLLSEMTRNSNGQIDSIEQNNRFTAYLTYYNYDDFGYLESIVSPTTGTTTYTTDKDGNITGRTLANGSSMTVTFDALDRPLTETATKSGVSNETVTLAYDNTTAGQYGIGRLSSATDPSGTTTYQYDRLGNITSKQESITSTTWTLAATYDVDGNMASLSPYAGETLSYTYDFADRPYSVSDASGSYVTSATYAPFGPWSQIAFGNGTTQTRTFNSALQPITDIATAGSNLTYSYLPTGQLSAITDNAHPAYSHTFSYDEGTATNSISGDTTTGTPLLTSTYSVNGDTEDGLSNIALGSSGYTLSFTQPNLLTSVSGTSVSEDASGNETAYGSNAYTYSPRNYLASGDGLTYQYDWRGKRVATKANGSTRRSYLYGSDSRLIFETGPTNSQTTGQLYVWLGDVPVAEVALGTQPTTYTVATNIQGAPSILTQGSNQHLSVAWQADYYPFGQVYKVRGAGANLHQPLRLPGQEAEQISGNSPVNGDTNRYYNQARWTRPALARFTQPDPLGLFPDTTNLYAYDRMNPEIYMDPGGFSGEGYTIGLGWLFGVGVGGGGTEAVNVGIFEDANGTVTFGGSYTYGNYGGLPQGGFSTPGIPENGPPSSSGFGAPIGSGLTAGLSAFVAPSAGSVDGTTGAAQEVDVGAGPLSGSWQIAPNGDKQINIGVPGVGIGGYNGANVYYGTQTNRLWNITLPGWMQSIVRFLNLLCQGPCNC